MAKKTKHKLNGTPVIFAKIYQLLKTRYPYKIYFTLEELRRIIGNAVHVPKEISRKTVREMELCDLLKRQDARKWKILRYDYQTPLKEAKSSIFWD